MNHDQFDELCVLYTLNLLDPEESDQFEQHLNGPCATCEETLRTLTEVTSLLPYALPQTGPSPALKERILTSIQNSASLGSALRPEPERSAVPRVRTSRWIPLTIAIAACLVLSLGVVALYFNHQINQQRATIEQLTSRVTELTERTTALTLLLQTMTDPDVKSIRLTGLQPEPRASGKAFIDVRAQTVLFYAYGLVAAPPGKTYQLWAIPKGKKPISAGIFAADSTGSASLTVRRLADVDRLETLAVTLEPAGGLPQPSGPMYLVGS